MATYGYFRKKENTELNASINSAFEKYTIKKAYFDQEENTIELEILMKELRENDTLVIYDLLDFNMRLHALVGITDYLNELNIHLISIQNNIDTNSEKDKTFYYVLSELNSVDRTIISKRLKHGLQKASEEGRIGGRPSIDEDLRQKILYLREHKKMSMRSIAEECDVSVGTVYKYSKIKEQ